MRRFFFDVKEGSRVITDKEGRVMTGLDAAAAHAAEVAAAIARDALPRRKVREVTVRVSNTQHEPVLSVTVSMEVKRY